MPMPLLGPLFHFKIFSVCIELSWNLEMRRRREVSMSRTALPQPANLRLGLCCQIYGDGEWRYRRWVKCCFHLPKCLPPLSKKDCFVVSVAFVAPHFPFKDTPSHSSNPPESPLFAHIGIFFTSLFSLRNFESFSAVLFCWAGPSSSRLG